MKPRLDALLRQRELIREHLRWLDAEIESARGERSSSRPETVPAPAPVLPLVSSVDAPPAPSAEAQASSAAEIPQEVDVHSLHNEVRRGCFIYAAIGTGIVLALVAFIYWTY